MNDAYDDTLFSILKEAKTVSNFFDVIFGFLYRRTDFYHVSDDPNLGVGFGEGVTENIILQSYKRYIYNEVLSLPPALEEIVISEEVLPIENESSNLKQETNNAETNIKTETKLDCYNGAEYEGYSWSQTITDIDIQIKIPDKITTKQLDVNITSANLNIQSKINSTIYLSGELCRKCKAQDSFWSFDGEILQIHLEKVSESWWDCLLQFEPRLDLSKMDCSRPFHELPEEAQAKIEELQWNQERKRQGLPTSDQLELEKNLKKAWNVEGSPFSGEYDPSKVKLH